MNSIESYSPPKVSSLDSEDSLTGGGPLVDAAALENLRALMGGIVLPQPGFQQNSNPSMNSEDEPGSGLLSLLNNLLAEDQLPPDLKSLIAGLRETLATGGGDAESNAGAAEQMKALLGGLKGPELQTQVPTDLKKTLADALTQELARAETSRPLRPEIQTSETGGVLAEVPSLGNAILQSLGSQSSTAAGPAAEISGPAAAERVEQVSSLMTQMADRVLVTDPLHGQTAEVRIKLADNIMPGTEVRVWREDGGQLRVEFDTVSPYWARVLNEASPLLSQRLNERLPLAEPAQVTVQQNGNQPEDGRSRNRHTPWELAQNQANEP